MAVETDLQRWFRGCINLRALHARSIPRVSFDKLINETRRDSLVSLVSVSLAFRSDFTRRLAQQQKQQQQLVGFVSIAICVSRSREGSRSRSFDRDVRATRIPREKESRKATVKVFRDGCASRASSSSSSSSSWNESESSRETVGAIERGPPTQPERQKVPDSLPLRSFFPFYPRSMINSHGRFVSCCNRVLPPHQLTLSFSFSRCAVLEESPREWMNCYSTHRLLESAMTTILVQWRATDLKIFRNMGRFCCFFWASPILKKEKNQIQWMSYLW